MAHSNNSLERKKSFKRGSKKATDYFSVGSKDDSDLPTFFINCVTHLEEHALDEEGILRIHGRTQDTNAINAFLLSNNTNEKRATTLGQVDPHAVATLLKSYLNQGPPLLPMEHYSAFVDIGSKKKPEGEVLLFLRDVICGIPLSHQRVLHRVLIFIDNVQQHSSKNKMDVKALSIIFSPLLLRAPTEVSPAQILSQMQSSINCVHLLILNYQAIFEGIGLNSVDASPASPVLSAKDGNLRDFSTTSISKDKVKVRFLLYFTIKTGGCIQDTVSLFLKYSKQGVKRETGQTMALVCTNPQEVVWEEVVPLEVTLVVNRRTKVFEPRNFVVTLKCATTKGSKTLGAASINLAELSPASLQASPREEVKTYEMIHKGGKSKTLQLVVKSYSEWRKLNNKLVVRQEESNSSSRRYSVNVSQGSGPDNSQRPDDPASRFVTMRGRAALLSMPNLANFDAHRTEKSEDERFPLSARENKSESALLTPTKAPENLFSSSPSTTTLSSSPSSTITIPQAPYNYVPVTTPPSLEKVPAPDFTVAAAPSLPPQPHDAPLPQDAIAKSSAAITTSASTSDSTSNLISTSVELPSTDLASSTNSGPPSPTNIVSNTDSHSLTSSVSSTGSRSSSPITVSVGPIPTDNTSSTPEAPSPTVVSPRPTSSTSNEPSSSTAVSPRPISSTPNGPSSTISDSANIKDTSPNATISEPSAPITTTTARSEPSTGSSTEDPKNTNHSATDKERTMDGKESAKADKERATGTKEPAKTSDRDHSSSSDKDNSSTHHKHQRHTTHGDKHQIAEEKVDTPRVRRASLKAHLDVKIDDEKHAESNSDKVGEKESSRKSHSRRSSPTRKHSPRRHSPRKHSHDGRKEDEKDAHEKSSGKDVISPRKPQSRKSSPKKHSSHEDSKDDERNTEGEKSSEKEPVRTRERSHSHPAKSERRRSEKHEKPLVKLAEPATHPELAVKQAEPAKPSEPASKSTELAREEPKKEDISSEDQSNGTTSLLRKKELTISQEFAHPGKREKRLTITELNIPSESSSARVSPTDEGESDLESDNDFEGGSILYAQKMFELTEQIELLQQQRRQLELETFNLRKCLVHNEIYRPQTLDFSERGISSTAEQIIENLFKMNCFSEPQNFLPSFFESIIISLQQESKNEVEVPKILYWLSTTLGLLYLLSLSIKSIPDPAVHGVAILTKVIEIDESEASNENLVEFARGVQRTGLELYNKILKIFEKQLDDEKLVLAFLGRPKEKEEKRNFVIKEKSSESGMKTPEPVLTPAVALREILREISENYELLKDAMIFENFAWHMALHRLFYLDNLLVQELSTQKKLYSTDAQTIKQATLEVERRMREKFPTQSMPCPLKMTTQFVALVTAEYSKLDSETYVNNSFTLLKPSQILQILEVLRPDKDSRKPVPASVQKLLQAMSKSETDKPRVVPMTWHLSDEITKLSQVVN